MHDISYKNISYWCITLFYFDGESFRHDDLIVTQCHIHPSSPSLTLVFIFHFRRYIAHTVNDDWKAGNTQYNVNHDILPLSSTDLDWMTNMRVGELGHHWFRQRVVRLWLTNCTLRNKLKRKLNKSLATLIQENLFENVVSKMAVVMSLLNVLMLIGLA